MLKKSLLSLAITASVAGLSGCNISSVTDNDQNTPDSQIAQDAVESSRSVAPLFDTVSSVIPLGSDLIFATAATYDGTANIATDGTNPVVNALNDLDGGISTLAPIDILMDGSVESDTVNSDNVFLVKLPNKIDAASLVLPTLEFDVDGEFVGTYVDSVGLVTDTNTTRTMTAEDLDALDLASIAPLFSTLKADGTAADDSGFFAYVADPVNTAFTAPESVAVNNLLGSNFQGTADGIVFDQPVAGTDYDISTISLNGTADNAIRITPTTPLDGRTKYFVVVTKGVEDTTGAAISESVNYEHVSGTDDLFSTALAPVRTALAAWELLAQTVLSTAGKDVTLDNSVTGTVNNIAITSAYTTVDPATVLKSMAYPGFWTESAIVGNNATVAAGVIAQAANGDATATATYAGMVAVAEANGLTNDEANIFVAGYLTSSAYVAPNFSTPQARNYEHISAETDTEVTLDQIPLITMNADFLAVGGDKVLVSQGAIELPQYTTSLATNSNSIWEANTAVGTALDLLSGSDDGTTPPLDSDDTTNVTYRYPFAEQQRTSVVPLMIVEPIDTAKQAAYAAVDPRVVDSGCTKDVNNGWPVIIAQHGFTVNRAGTILTAASLASSTCSVVVAMDLPHHGVAPQTTDRDGNEEDSRTRGFTTTYNAFTSDADADEYSPWAVGANALATADEASILNDLEERHEEIYAVTDPTTGVTTVTPMSYEAGALAGQSGDFFINLTNFQRSRDNLRQGVMDLLNLNATLSSIDIDGDGAADLDVSQVSYVGHSLGGIVGTTFVAVNNDKTVQLASSLVGTLDTSGDVILPKITEAVLATPGGGIPKLLESSISIGTSIKAGLLAAAEIAPGDADFESFMGALQATLDTVDPLNFISDLAAGGVSETPVMLIEMIGGAAIADGTTTEDDVSLPTTYLDLADVYPADFVVPNNTSSNTDETAQVTLAGTDPMITALTGFTQVPSTASTTTPTSYPVAKFTAGTHSTFSGADATFAFGEMMTEAGSFILSSGTSVTTSAASALVLDSSAD